MQCEICGNNIREEPIKIKIDLSELLVCNNCSKYGIAIRESIKTNSNIIRESKYKENSSIKKNYFKDLEKSIVENYDELIRKERIKKNISQEELANKIKEKTHLIKKIERKDIVPEEEIIRKLEQVLKIKLLSNDEENITNEKNTKKTMTYIKEITIGDIVSIKKK